MSEDLAVNLIPEEEVNKRRWEKFLKWVLTVGRYIIIGTEIIVMTAFLFRFKLDHDLITLSDEVKSKKQLIESFGNLETKTRNLQSYLATIKKIQDQSPSYVNMINSLSTITPYDVIFSQIRVSENQIKLSATAISLGGFSSFLENLKLSKDFKDINLERVKRGSSGIEFSLQFSYQGGQK